MPGGGRRNSIDVIPSDPNNARHWAVIPAAGAGRRMGATLPKQYLTLCGQTVLAHTLTRLARHPAIHGVMVVLAEDDEHFKKLSFSSHKNLFTALGGEERCDSVLNGLRALDAHARKEDWVLVHDAARPCVRGDDITRLVECLRDHPVGGLLGLPVADTMKRADDEGNITATVPREGLWRALTPQMFRYGLLREALEAAVRKGMQATDEAQAMEAAGHVPRMIEGHADNIKITRPRDLALAELYLKRQESV